MSGSSFGTLFQVTTWGESHGPGVGVVIDGCPAGISLTEKDIQTFLDRRKPGQSKYTTKRNESDTVEILSGVFEGRTTGTVILPFPTVRVTRISVSVRNTVSGITVGVDVLPAVKPSDGLLRVQLLPFS